MSARRALIVDHNDSFAFNLFQALGELDVEPIVLRSNVASLAAVEAIAPSAIVLSPGPGSPEDPHYAGTTLEIIQRLGPRTPILGVCFGHQAIIAAFGGRIVRANRAVHGRASPILHRGDPLFAGLPRPFLAMRYHSLVGEPGSLPEELLVTATLADDPHAIMAVAHRRWPIAGVQFHPESIGTPHGKLLLQNFLYGPKLPG
jgi:anthranilate synthase/aminodeoxychorismate synthase-like glutamine amidotransferase